VPTDVDGGEEEDDPMTHMAGLMNSIVAGKKKKTQATSQMKKSDSLCTPCNDYKTNSESHKPITVCRDYEVPEIAGYNYNNTVLYIDRRVPQEFKGFNVDSWLIVHEETEKAIEDRLGFNYPHAHTIATAAERKAVELSGCSWDEYDAWMQKIIKDLENTAKDVPPDLQDPNKISGI